MEPFAEVIGDPVSHSLSPLIHRYWLQALGLSGDYRATGVQRSALARFFEERRTDPLWRGCNVTIPHKETAAALVDQLDPVARIIGAINCVVAGAGGLTGYNTDVDGVAAALDTTPLEGRTVAMIGGGGAARAVVAYCARRQAGRLIVLARDPIKARTLAAIQPDLEVEVRPLGDAGPALMGVSAIINASPLGMLGSPPMPGDLLDAIGRAAERAVLFDMVYKPVGTSFLAAGASFLAAGDGRSPRVVGGLTMLVGQARRAFELFFGAATPADERALRDLLATASEHSSAGVYGDPSSS